MHTFLMNRQITIFSKCFTTKITREWFFTGVNSIMKRLLKFAMKFLVANITFFFFSYLFGIFFIFFTFNSISDILTLLLADTKIYLMEKMTVHKQIRILFRVVMLAKLIFMYECICDAFRNF